MIQVFTDQCRSAYQDKGTWGLFPLWARSLLDLVISALREQITSPRASWGLLEAVPNTPLPWKGVSLVLIPGLIFFISQIGQLTGQDWFFLMLYRAGYFLIIPVVLVWAWKRTFPVWGLIPLGLLIKTLVDAGTRLQELSLNSDNPISARLMNAVAKTMTYEQIGVVIGILALIVFLVVLEARRQPLSPTACVWAGSYLLLTAINILASYWTYGPFPGFPHHFNAVMVHYLGSVGPTLFLSDMGFLLGVLLGTQLARRQGHLAILVPLGYLLPAVLYGRFYFVRGPDALFWVSTGVFAYRLVIAVIAPVWIVRSASDRSKRRAAAIALLVGIGIQLVETHWFWGPMDGVTAIYAFSVPLITAAGIALALSLYQGNVPTPTAVVPAGKATESAMV
jgi:hypothetical protein